MNKELMVIPLCVLAVSCASTTRSVPIVDDAGHTHYTMAHDLDTRGAHAFPDKRQATGRKVFIFDPKATAWGAYDAQGNLVKTGAASGGKSYCEDVGRPCKTVTGTYSVYSKKGEDCKSGKYPIETGGGARCRTVCISTKVTLSMLRTKYLTIMPVMGVFGYYLVLQNGLMRIS